jgi:chromatin segregation and condensation protein Rec8/ScpA/Scc1 (kleisin family)
MCAMHQKNECRFQLLLSRNVGFLYPPMVSHMDKAYNFTFLQILELCKRQILHLFQIEKYQNSSGITLCLAALCLSTSVLLARAFHEML